MQSRQSVQQLLEDESINAKADQLSYLKRITKAIDPTPPPPSAEDSSASSATQTNKILSDLATLPGVAYRRAEVILNKIYADPNSSVDASHQILLNGVDTGVRTESFLWDLQQTAKNLSSEEKNIIKHLRLPEHLVTNKDAKIIIQTGKGAKQEKPTGSKRPWST